MGYVKESINFKLRGKIYNLSVDDVVSSMKGIRPIGILKYYVRIGDMDYPPKQVLSESLGIQRISFTTKDAYDILTRLGFVVEE